MAESFRDLSKRILRLSPTRVWRTYLGGKVLEEWQGKDTPTDGELPEDWIGSTVHARNLEREYVQNEGLSRVALEDGGDALLKDLIESDPASFLGRNHYQKYGSSPAVLIKMIDSLSRLAIQVHPDKAFAKEVFQSDYGKTEAWYILGGRTVNGEEPYVMLGFKQGITKEKWRHLFEIQDIEGMLNCLHKIPVTPGEVYFIEGGVPHAIGSGCFLIEIQEPTDYTMRVEKVTPEGRQITDAMCHQGAGFDNLFKCFHYNGYTREEVYENWRLVPRLLNKNTAYEEWELIGAGHADFFSMKKVIIRGEYRYYTGDCFSNAVVISGHGKVHDGYVESTITQGDRMFIPAQTGQLTWTADEASVLELIFCYPPK
jgi:mannose-6-phosphate isomerase